MALPVGGGGVVNREEHAQEVAKTQNRAVKGHLDDLGVARTSAAHLAIGGIVRGAACIAGDNGGHALEFIEDRLETPEAPPTDRDCFQVVACHHSSCCKHLPGDSITAVGKKVLES